MDLFPLEKRQNSGKYQAHPGGGGGGGGGGPPGPGPGGGGGGPHGPGPGGGGSQPNWAPDSDTSSPISMASESMRLILHPFFFELDRDVGRSSDPVEVASRDQAQAPAPAARAADEGRARVHVAQAEDAGQALVPALDVVAAARAAVAARDGVAAEEVAEVPNYDAEDAAEVAALDGTRILPSAMPRSESPRS